MWGKIFSGIGLFILCYIIYSNLDLAHSIDEYEGETPRMNMENFFAHKVEGWGAVYAINGAIRSRFHIGFNSNAINGNDFYSIRSQILFDDDEKIEETFALQHKEQNSFMFQAKNFPQQILVSQVGNVFQLKYILSYESGKHYFSNTGLNIHCSLVNKNIAMCHGNVKKMGILLGRTFFTLHSLNYEKSFNKI